MLGPLFECHIFTFSVQKWPQGDLAASLGGEFSPVRSESGNDREIQKIS
jgi:hypothetical protein